MTMNPLPTPRPGQTLREIGDRLREERRRLGWAPEDCGFLFDLPQGGWNALESGAAPIPDTLLRRLRMSGFDTTYIADGDGSTPRPLPRDPDTRAATTRQAPPRPGRAQVVPAVLRDLEARSLAGQAKYGRPLETHNGRSALVDLYQELLDACCYIKQQLLEQADAERGAS